MSAPAPVAAQAPRVGKLAPAMTTVGALARRHGLARSTLLYYDRIGLLRPPARSAAGYRRYGPEEERRLELICRYRRAGLTLAAISQILDGPSGSLSQALEARLADLDREIEALHDQMRLIAGLLQRPDLLRRAGVIDKRAWVDLLAASGMSAEAMRRWHADFERTAPDEHLRFLELLGLPAAEIAAIRRGSA